MDEQVERVAKALKRAVRGAPVTEEEWLALPENRKEMWRNEARAAIAAIQSPEKV